MNLSLFILSTSTENDEEKENKGGGGGGGENNKTLPKHAAVSHLFHSPPAAWQLQHALLNDRHKKTNSTAL